MMLGVRYSSVILRVSLKVAVAVKSEESSAPQLDSSKDHPAVKLLLVLLCADSERTCVVSRAVRKPD
tara:strand:- start:378 stop:578 length:201 start_codon:yes stop_codon:yes gene_type:complete